MGEPARTIEPLIMLIRGCRVVLDADLARLYGVTTGRFNEGFKRNRRRFPEEFAFQLTPAEFAALKAQAHVSDSQPTDSNKEKVNLSQIAIGSQKHRDRRLSAILQRLAEIDATLLQHDSALRDIYRKLLPLLQPPPDPPKRRIEFHPE